MQLPFLGIHPWSSRPGFYPECRQCYKVLHMKQRRSLVEVIFSHIVNIDPAVHQCNRILWLLWPLLLTWYNFIPACLLLLISMLWHRQAIFKSKGDKFSSSAECRIRTQGIRHLFASRLNACWQTDWAIEDQAKTWTRQPVPMISKHSAHSTSLPVGFRTWLWRYTCLLLLISKLWHKQAIFESKGDKLSSSAKCRIRTQGLRHLFASRLNACWQTDWAIEDQAKNLNSTARPYDQQAFSPLDLTASWLSHLALAIYMFVVVNFDALAQASDIRIERRQVVFLCWMQDSNPRSQTPIRQQTECLLTNRLSYRGSC